MNYRQTLFCEAYIENNGNGTQAAIKAGYAEDRADVTACEFLNNNDEIKAYIEKRQQQLAAKLQINQERVLQEYSRIAFSDIRKLYDDNNYLKNVTELDDDAAASLASVEVDEIWGQSGEGKTQIGQTKKVKIFDKIRGLEGICKVLGYNSPDKTDVTTKGESLNDAGIQNLTNDEKLHLLRLKQKMRDGA